MILCLVSLSFSLCLSFSSHALISSSSLAYPLPLSLHSSSSLSISFFSLSTTPRVLLTFLSCSSGGRGSIKARGGSCLFRTPHLSPNVSVSDTPSLSCPSLLPTLPTNPSSRFHLARNFSQRPSVEDGRVLRSSRDSLDRVCVVGRRVALHREDLSSPD